MDRVFEAQRVYRGWGNATSCELVQPPSRLIDKSNNDSDNNKFHGNTETDVNIDT